MRRITFTIAIITSAVMLAGCQRSGSTPMAEAGDAGWNQFGDAEKVGGPTVALASLSGGEKGVIVEGTITSVCPKKGCWMRVTDGEEELFVRFKDYGFFVPRNATGHKVVIHGISEAKVLSVDELRHYAEDAGKSAEEIAAITEPESSITFYADSVYIDGKGLDAPWEAAPATQPATQPAS